MSHIREILERASPGQYPEPVYWRKWCQLSEDYDAADVCSVYLYEVNGEFWITTSCNGMSGFAKLVGKPTIPEEDWEPECLTNPGDEEAEDENCKEWFKVGYVPGTYLHDAH